MGYSYIPGGQGGDPARAMKLLLKSLLIVSGIGFVRMLLKRIFGNGT